MKIWQTTLCVCLAMTLNTGFAQDVDSLDEDLFNQLTEGLDLGENSAPTNEEESAKQPDSDPQSTGEPKTTDGENPPSTDANVRDITEANFTGDGPLDEIGRRMRRVEQRLQVADSGKQTQQVQAEILQQLEELLKLKKQKNSQSNSSQSRSPQQQASRETPEQQNQQPQESRNGPRDNSEGQPENQNPNQVEESTDRQDSNTTIQTEQFADRFNDYLEAEWGHLPIRERNMVIQSFRERFLPQYDQMIRDYYERLAKERPRIP